MQQETMEQGGPVPKAAAPPWLPAAVAAAAAFALVLVVTAPWGAGQVQDSAWYLAAGRGLASGEGFVKYDGRPASTFPPLVPAYLAALALIGLEPTVAARVVGALFYALTVFVAGRWLSKRVLSRPLAAAGLVAVFLPVALFRTSVLILTEPAFNLFVLLALLLLARHLERPDERRSLWLSAAFAALACLTRYAGLPLVIACAAALLLDRRKPPAKRVADTTVFGAVSCLPAGLWVVRNVVVSGTCAGFWGKSLFGLAANVRRTLDALSVEVVPRAVPGVLRFTVLGVLGAALLALAIRLIRRRPATLATLAPLLVFVVAYPVFIVVSSTLARYAQIGWRILSPIYMPALLLALVVIDGTIEGVSDTLRRRTLRTIATVLLAAWCAYPASRVVYFARQCFTEGPGGFNTRRWRESRVIDFLRKNPPEGTIYSNNPEAIYVLLGRRAELGPGRPGPTSLTPLGGPGGLAEFRAAVAGGATLAWFNDTRYREYLYTPDEMKETVVLFDANDFPEGAVFAVAPRHGSPPPQPPK